MVPVWPGDGGLGEPGHVGVVDGGERLADEVAGLAPAGAEDERDVVARRARCARRSPRRRPGPPRRGRSRGRPGRARLAVGSRRQRTDAPCSRRAGGTQVQRTLRIRWHPAAVTDRDPADTEPASRQYGRRAFLGAAAGAALTAAACSAEETPGASSSTRRRRLRKHHRSHRRAECQTPDQHRGGPDHARAGGPPGPAVDPRARHHQRPADPRGGRPDLPRAGPRGVDAAGPRRVPRRPMRGSPSSRWAPGWRPTRAWAGPSWLPATSSATTPGATSRCRSSTRARPLRRSPGALPP